jgi:hypothetical protein
MDNGPVNQPGPRRHRVNIYAAATVLGVVLIAVGIVGGVVTKDFSVIATVATTVPGIGFFLYGIRGHGGDPVDSE